MPWTIADVEKHNKGLTDKQKKQWVAVANSVREKCIAAGGTDESCSPQAIRQANGVVANAASVNYDTIIVNYQIQEVNFQGKTHIVVPVVMMIEGVHAGSAGPLLHPADELGKFPQSWNGIPVVINHPQVEGYHVSANSPDLLDGQDTVGKVFNTHMDGDKLKAEAYIDKEKLRKASPEAYKKIMKNQPLDVSIGVFTEEDPVQGDWNGEHYNSVARGHRPDHLALLPDAAGACSWKDGCGVRTNKKGGKMNDNAQVTDMEEKREELGMSVSEFYAIPKDPPSESKLPIFDAAHTRNALARFNQVQGVSAEEKATAKRKILAKAKKFGIDAKGLADNMQTEIFEALQSAKEVGLNVNLENYIKFKTKGGKMERTVKPCTGRCVEKVIALCTNAATKFTESDRKWLLTQEETDLDKFLPNGFVFNKDGEIVKGKKVAKGASDDDEDDEPNANTDGKDDDEYDESGKVKDHKDGKMIPGKNLPDDDDPETGTGPAVSKKGMKRNSRITPAEVYAALSFEDRAAMEYGKRQLAERRQNLISGIQANTSVELWPTKVLNTMNEDMLNRIFNSVQKEETVDYSANYSNMNNFRGGLVDNAGDVEPLLPVFDAEPNKK